MSEEKKIKKTNKKVERAATIGSEGGQVKINYELIKSKRDQEKHELTNLNEGLGVYVNRVKILERQNIKLLSELDGLKNKHGLDLNRLRNECDPPLMQHRIKLDDLTKEKVVAEVKAKRAEYDAINFKRNFDVIYGEAKADENKIRGLMLLLNENKAEIDALNRQLISTESDVSKYKNQAINLNGNLVKLLDELDEATVERLKIENEKQTLEEQIPFLNAVYEQEILELRTISTGALIDPAQFYRHELERVIRDIRNDFEFLNEENKRELEEWYKVKIEEIRNEYAKQAKTLNRSGSINLDDSLRLSNFNELQSELNNLKLLNNNFTKRFQQIDEELRDKRVQHSLLLTQKERELDEVRGKYNDTLVEVDALMNNKISLEFEITTYRRLLDLENAKLAKKEVVVPQIDKHKKDELSSSSSIMNAKNIINKTAKGPITIAECSVDGKCITIENVSKNVDVNIENWILKRKIDGLQDDIMFTFPKLTLKAGRLVRVWTKDYQNPTEFDLVNQNLDSWGLGLRILTIILNENGEEKSTYDQKMVFGV
jgi:intermediate filament protein if